MLQKYVHYKRYDYFIWEAFLVHDFHISWFYWEALADIKSMNALENGKKTCKFFVIYSQASGPSVEKFLWPISTFVFFQAILTQIYEYVLRVLCMNMYDKNRPIWYLHNQQEKKARTWLGQVDLCTCTSITIFIGRFLISKTMHILKWKFDVFGIFNYFAVCAAMVFERSHKLR